jgi:hypothetical protein
LSENILPMQESGQQFYQRPRWSGAIRTRIRIFFADGHTDKQMIPHIQYNGKTIVLWLIYCNSRTHTNST